MKELDMDMTMKLEFEEFLILFTNIMKNQHKTFRNNLLSKVPNIDTERHWVEVKDDLKVLFDK